MSKKKNGENFWVEINLKITELGGKGRVLAVIRDITERKMAEEKLRKSEEWHRRFFEQDLAAAFISTPEGKILECNQAFLKIFGIKSKEEALNTSALSFYNSEKSRNKLMERLHIEKKLKNFEYDANTIDGRKIHLIESMIGIFDEKGEISQILGFIIDDTRRKELEAQFLQAMKMDSLGTLAGGIAHDFNNLLGIILGHTTILKYYKSDPEKFLKSIDAITKATERGASLVTQLLTFARKTDTQVESVKINDVIAEVMKLMLETFPRNIEIKTKLQAELPSINADSTQIHQILINIFVNSRDAMPSGGILEISTSTIEKHYIKLKFPEAQADKYILIRIADNGMGMDEKTRLRIFEPFFTTKEIGKGTGLGLSLVYSIVENHLGFIEVLSETGKGTEFLIYFPLPVNSLEKGHLSHGPIEEVPGGLETVFLIEDEAMLSDLLQASLESKGYKVMTAHNGEEGVQKHKQNQHEIDIIILDIGLPKLGGAEVLKKIMSLDPRAKVIIASGFINPELKPELYAAGAKSFIQKPYTPVEVLKVIREVLDS